MKIGRLKIVCKTTKYSSIYTHSFFIGISSHPGLWCLYISITGYMFEMVIEHRKKKEGINE